MNLRFKNLVFLLLLCLGANEIVAQSTIKGKVKDENGMPLPGVNLVLKDTTSGAVSDFDGNYEIVNIADGTYTLNVSFLGYSKITKFITVTGEDIIQNFIMSEDSESLDQIIITGVTNPKSKIESSISITSLRLKTIENSAPRTSVMMFRTVPGIRSESSGGEGNSNIAVRGVPISSGGSKYVQLQEDGLPVLLFGDMSFATADIFTRFDANVKRIEAIRGGSASTLSSNSPGAIINFISKTGKVEGGSLSTNFGLDYNSFRTDFDYGTPIGEDLYFHMGGFYRVGEGIRDAGYTANNGGQFKFNITKEFEKGFVRLSAKYLNDRAIGYLPMPIQVTGSNNNPTFNNAPGFDATQGTLHTPFLSQNIGLGANGELRRSKVADGMHPVSTSIGLLADFELVDGWKIKNNGRFSVNNGSFVSPFPASVGTAENVLAGDFATDNGWNSFTYANDGSAVSDTQLVTPVVLFDTKLNNFNNFMNDLRLSKSFDKLDVTLGFFKSYQNVSMSWLWNSYLLEASSDNARLINIADASGASLSDNGLFAYGAALFGNCCQRNYDTNYNISAPYAQISYEASEKLNFDGSVRLDLGKVDGTFSGPVGSAFDVNRDGVISAPEQNVQSINNANPTVVDYDYNYVSYSFGVNYKLKDNQAVFARYSKGASAKADRILFASDANGDPLNYLDGDDVNALDFLSQAELGYKQGFKNGTLYATAFYSKTTEEGGFEASTQEIIENDYKSFGLEVEGSYRINNFDFRAGVTYTKAEIDSGDNEGNTPRRQPDFIYNLLPSYNFGANKQNTIGLSFIGQSEAYAQDSNALVLPAFVIVNSFVRFGITEGLSANISANNIFDTLGITESEEGAITEGQVNYIRARPVPGRSISLGLSYNF